MKGHSTAALALLVFVISLSGAQALTLKSFKDDLFSYPGVLESDDGGGRIVVDYRESRDIDARDEVPERRVNGNYVRLSVRSAQQDLTLRSDRGDIRHVAVGRTSGATAIVVYLHGQGGSRRQGVDDFTFGGNFNRIKNLMWDNGGLYLSPDFSDFGPRGVAEIATLLDHYAKASPGAPIVAACGSMGGAICWGLAGEPAIAGRLSGLMLLGSFAADDFARSIAFRRKVPLFLGQGSRDKVFPVETQEDLYRRLRGEGYPVRLVRFESGTHGTPIRMTDWREVLNWMLSR
jgi:pimeloyl-ACP methyl ester carboxylesterase